MREVPLAAGAAELEVASLQACVETVLELEAGTVPPLGDRPLALLHRWLQGFGLGLAEVAEPDAFSWPGPWIARLRAAGEGSARYVVMFGVPSGVVWDPAGGLDEAECGREAGFLIAAADIALARPAPLPAPLSGGTVDSLWIAAQAGKPLREVPRAGAVPGRGLEGDRYAGGAGTFPTGVPGSALTLIEAEVCESFSPPLAGADHRRNVVTRGIELNGLVGAEFTVGAVRCRGMRLCEPCTVMQRYAGRSVLRPLVHRGGLRADILTTGEIAVGDPVRVL